jgi:AraC-like DNA-binding protein
VFFRVEAGAPWVAETPVLKPLASQLMPGAEHVIEYHVIASGECWGGVVGQAPIRLRGGDVIVFPQGDAHVLSSAPGMRAPPDLEMFRQPKNGRLPVSLSINSHASERAQLVCGFLGCDASPFNPLLASLPRVMHHQNTAGQSAWIEQLVRVAVDETSTQTAGGETLRARLSELLFIEVVRRYLANVPREATGWLAGLRDDIVGRSLSALHDRPDRTWSLDDLAKEIGVSRSVLAERFHLFVGVPPMQYLARWRMQLAASMLSGTNVNLAEVAERVGYGSEAALSRAFKRLIGVAPSAWREGQRPSSDVA